MGCTAAKIKSRKDLNLLNVPLQYGRKMSKEEGIVSREYKIQSAKKFGQQLKPDDQNSQGNLGKNQSNISNNKVQTSQ